MAENDIYKNQERYDRFKRELSNMLIKPKETGLRSYYIKNPANVYYFKELFKVFETKDQSYVRRIRLLMSLKIICFATDKELKDCQREDVDSMLAFKHGQYKSPKSKRDFIRDIKYLWRVLCPELDEKGRRDDTFFPYPVRHLSAKIDKSREKRRQDKLTWSEYEQLVAYFASDKRMQCYLTLSVESLARPQELLYLKLRDVEQHEGYARISISEHGKEGIGWLQCIDSYPYLLKWLEVHPFAKNPNAHLFLSLDRKHFGGMLRPESIAMKLKSACQNLGIQKNITGYSLKRNGVTFRRLRGESDLEIMHAARWTSTRQLQTYDLSERDDAFKIALAKRGIIKDETIKMDYTTKECWFCQKIQSFGNHVCENCKRPLDRRKIAEAIKAVDRTKELEQLADPKMLELLRKLVENPQLLSKLV
jgi:integrase/recombinase XerD